MTLKLTQPPVLRQRILSVLASTESGSLDATEVKNRVNEIYGHLWNDRDREKFLSRPVETKWWSRLGTQHQRMSEDGLLEPHAGEDVWTLTPKGWAADRALTLDGYDRERELERRQQMWQALLYKDGPANVEPSLLRALEIFVGQPGICVPAMTRTPATPDGVAVSLLNTGKHYADEVTATGAIYHYPNTARNGRHDESEINAAKAAFGLGLPVFLITPGSPQNTRTVHRGYIEDMDDTQQVLLVTFADGELPSPPTKGELEAAFKLTDDEALGDYSLRKNRKNQARFAFNVYKRYGTGCAVCGFTVQGLVQAAHLLSKKNNGSDDARNGLPLCANHHLAFDRHYWCIDPDLKIHAKNDGPTLETLAIVRTDLSHLALPPHDDAVTRIWNDWQSRR
ncbi:HNH endonuclease [Arthrobacter sp. GMC3]|uniref:HNH endonuclease n=1 Tax=Arthrobacter sp. GMC3 TaxID=2058894 RepID=UPI000CE3A59A|nr:HNH endonuclease [Arthrobacter sp. GMC3]